MSYRMEATFVHPHGGQVTVYFSPALLQDPAAFGAYCEQRILPQLVGTLRDREIPFPRLTTDAPINSSEGA